MTLPPTISTSQAGMDGTTSGMIITAIVSLLALLVLIGMVYRASSHPDVRPPATRWPDGDGPAAEPTGAVPGRVEPDSLSRG
jgi:hypothetical protein